MKVLVRSVVIAVVAGLALAATQASAGTCGSRRDQIDIWPCPPAPPEPRMVCDPARQVYDIEGYLDRWISFMEPVDESCQIEYDDFKFHLITPGSQWLPDQQCHCEMDRIILRPLFGNQVTATQGIARQRDWRRRRAEVTGCFALGLPNVFLVEWIGYARVTDTDVQRPVPIQPSPTPAPAQ